MATVSVVAFGLGLRLAREEWIAVILAIGMVWMAEALNTAIEFLADDISHERHDLLGKAKDAGAAGVLFASFSALAVGLLVFVPHLIAYIRQYVA
jgi:diacylglycerol kinase